MEKLELTGMSKADAIKQAHYINERFSFIHSYLNQQKQRVYVFAN
jgi:hypothetical protein